MASKITLKAARVNSGMTQEELSKRLGVSRRLIIDWESGKAPMKAAYVYAFCAVTGFTPEDIILPESST